MSLSILVLMELHKLSWYLRQRRRQRTTPQHPRPRSA